MQSNTPPVRRLWHLALVAVAMLAFGPSLAAADYVVNSGETVVISDDVYNRTVSVASLTGGPDSTKAKSGFADGSNPGNAADNEKSGKGGSDNPNQAKK